MFRAYTAHLQTSFIDTVAQLPKSKQQRLDDSWAGTFYRDVFCRIDEAPFAVLYSDDPSRPNSAVNTSVGLELLKSGFGWSDEELFDHLLFDVQTRYALGIRDIHAEVCTLRTQYNFRDRVSQHMQETGENLFEQVFEQVTDAQLAELELKTGHQRMDSTQIGSNIRRYTRLQLLVETVQRAARMLDEQDQAQYADLLAPYVQGTAGQYCYRIKNGDLNDHLQHIGQVMYRLVDELGDRYGDQEGYRLLRRVFTEHFDACSNLPSAEPTPLITSEPDAETTPGSETTATDTANSAVVSGTLFLTDPEATGHAQEVAPAETLSVEPTPLVTSEPGAETTPCGETTTTDPEAAACSQEVAQAGALSVTPKPSESLRADSLQSPDDVEATYRQKNGTGYRGYVVNLSETCDPENDLQLITSVQVAPNNTDDEALLLEALPDLQRRTQLDTLEIDGGYTGPDSTRTCAECGVTLNPSAIRGQAPDSSKSSPRLGLDAFTWETPTEGLSQVTCPNGQTVEVTCGRKPHRRQAAFGCCAQCALADGCPTVQLKRSPQRVLNVNQRQIEVAQLRQRCAQLRQSDHHLRPAVESTVRSVKHPFGDKLPVRGQIRVTMVVIASAMMVNLRRIWRFQAAQQARSGGQVDDQAQGSFLSLLQNWILALIGVVQSPFRHRSALYRC